MKKKIFIIITMIIIAVALALSLKHTSKNKFVENSEFDTNNPIATTIDGEISTTFPTTQNYTGTVTCSDSSLSGTVTWNGSKWILNVSGINNGNVKCNIDFKMKSLMPEKVTNDLIRIKSVISINLGDITLTDFVFGPSDNITSIQSNELERLQQSLIYDLGTFFEALNMTSLEIENFFAILPAEFETTGKLESVDEFIPIIVENYDPSFGDIMVNIECPPMYDTSDIIFALIGVYENNQYYYRANVITINADYSVQITFEPEILEQIMSNPDNAVLMIGTMFN